ncbi:glycosyltransferase family 4 protein [Clostridium perfringens]|uniref:glycosyltransferase family 4 protein n=1 Tax=Clostridium perfringens TaxID=1502 RepID=UPI0024BC3982|nr:glycosyltransferase family 4 protein [Clostridium perfringens]
MEKCLHILPMNKLSGAEKMALLMCKNMKNYKPIIFCGGEELKEIFEKNGIESYCSSFSSKNTFKRLSYLKDIIKNNNIKIIHAHDNTASLNAYLVKNLYKLDVKIISHIHNCYPWLKENGFNKKIDRFLRKRYDYNIVCGKIVYDFYKDNTDYLDDKKVEILSNAIDIEEIEKFNFSKNDEIIKKYNITKNKIILGFIGRLDHQKGLIPFIKEFYKRKDEFNDCVFLIVGSGSQEGEIKKLLKDLNIEEYFILTGFQKDTYKFYPLIDIFFLPSLYEGLPMVLLEAMAFKKAIISMDVGSINEIIIDGETGILIKNKDYLKFIDRLINIKNDFITRKKYEKNSFGFVKNKYNISNYISRLEKIYYDIIGGDLHG